MSLKYFLISNGTDRLILNTLGLIVSLYSWYVEIRKEHDPSYRAMCDISESISCTKALTSKYGRGFGLFGENNILNQRNCAGGAVFYISQILLELFHTPWSAMLLYYSSILSIAACVYLAFILFVVLKDVCLVCITTYVINGLIMYLNYSRYRKPK